MFQICMYCICIYFACVYYTHVNVISMKKMGLHHSIEWFGILNNRFQKVRT